VQEQQRDIPSVMMMMNQNLVILHGMRIIQAIIPIMSVRKNPIRGDCIDMHGNGFWNGCQDKLHKDYESAPNRWGVPGKVGKAHIVSLAAADGTSLRSYLCL